MGTASVHNALSGEGRLQEPDVIININTPTDIHLYGLRVSSRSMGFVIKALAGNLQIVSHVGNEYGILPPPLAWKRTRTVPLSVYAMEHLHITEPVVTQRASTVAYEFGNVGTSYARRVASAVVCFMAGDAAALRSDVGRFDLNLLETPDAETVIGSGIGPRTQTHEMVSALGMRTVFKYPLSDADAMTTVTMRTGVRVFPTLRRNRVTSIKSIKAPIGDLVATLTAVADVNDVKRYARAMNLGQQQADTIIGRYVCNDALPGTVQKSLAGDSLVFRAKHRTAHLDINELFIQVSSKGQKAQLHVLDISSGRAPYKVVANFHADSPRVEELLTQYHGRELAELSQRSAPANIPFISETRTLGAFTSHHKTARTSHTLAVQGRSGPIVMVVARDLYPLTCRTMSDSSFANTLDHPPTTINMNGSLAVRFVLALRTPGTQVETSSDVCVFPRRGYREAFANSDIEVEIHSEEDGVRRAWRKPLSGCAVELSGGFLPRSNSGGSNPSLTWVRQKQSQVFFSDRD